MVGKVFLSIIHLFYFHEHMSSPPKQTNSFKSMNPLQYSKQGSNFNTPQYSLHTNTIMHKFDINANTNTRVEINSNTVILCENLPMPTLIFLSMLMTIVPWINT